MMPKLGIHNPFRARPVAAAVGTLALCGFSLISFLLEQHHIRPRKYLPSYSPWRSDKPMDPHLYLDSSESAYLILILFLIGFLPLLELLGFIQRRVPVPPASGAAEFTKPAPAAASISSSSPGAASGTAGSSKASGFWSKLASWGARVYRYWIPNMSPTAACFAALYVIFIGLCLAIPIGTTELKNVDDPGFARLYKELNPDFKTTRTQGWIYVIGKEACWATMYAYAITLLPVSRTSPLLASIGMSYEETLAFHKFAGMSAVLLALMHGIFSTVPLLLLSWDWYATQAWAYGYANGRWMWAGQMSVLLQVVMVVFALQYFRKNHYKIFRVTHYLYPLVFMFSVMHDFVTFWYFLPGMILILSDVAQRLTNKVYTSTAALAATGSPASPSHECTVVLRVASSFGSFTPVADLIGRFCYVQVPEVSTLEWHPMSIAHADTAGTLTFNIKVYGSWTSSLHALAVSKPGSSVRVKLEGPYGYDWAAAARDRLFMLNSSTQQNSVAFVAGGLGIAPFTSAIAGLLSSAPHTLRSLQVLWSVRGSEVLNMYLPLLQRAAAHGATVEVHLTGDSVKAVPTSYLTDAENATASTMHCRSAAAAPASTAAAAKEAAYSAPSGASASFTKPAHAGKFWRVTSPLWSWFTGLIILYLSCTGAVIGTLLAKQMCTVYRPEDYKIPSSIIDKYETMVLANYAAAHEGALPDNEDGWPKDQTAADKIRVYEIHQLGRAPKYAQRCDLMPAGVVEPEYEYGRPDIPCRSMNDVFVCPAVASCLLSWGLALLLALVGGSYFAYLRQSHLRQYAGKQVEGHTAVDTHDLYTLTQGDDSSALSEVVHGGGGGAGSLTVHSGRACVDTYLTSAALACASSVGAGVSRHGIALDTYVCGGEALQSDVRVAFEQHVQPLCGASSYLGLSYAIG